MYECFDYKEELGFVQTKQEKLKTKIIRKTKLKCLRIDVFCIGIMLITVSGHKKQ